MKYRRYILLAIPLLWFMVMWLSYLFNIQLSSIGVFYDDLSEYHGDGLKETGLIPYSWFNFIGLVSMIPGFFIGIAYTIYNKLWLWLLAYIGLGGSLWFYLAN